MIERIDVLPDPDLPMSSTFFFDMVAAFGGERAKVSVVSVLNLFSKSPPSRFATMQRFFDLYVHKSPRMPS